MNATSMPFSQKALRLEPVMDLVQKSIASQITNLAIILIQNFIGKAITLQLTKCNAIKVREFSGPTHADHIIGVVESCEMTRYAEKTA
jgi:hypothetical protein